MRVCVACVWGTKGLEVMLLNKKRTSNFPPLKKKTVVLYSDWAHHGRVVEVVLISFVAGFIVALGK